MEFHGRNVNLLNRFGKFSRIKKGVPLRLREKHPCFCLFAASAFRRFQRHILERKAQRVAGNQIVSHPAV